MPPCNWGVGDAATARNQGGKTDPTTEERGGMGGILAWAKLVLLALASWSLLFWVVTGRLPWKKRTEPPTRVERLKDLVMYGFIVIILLIVLLTFALLFIAVLRSKP